MTAMLPAEVQPLLDALVQEINQLLQNIQKWLRQNHMLLQRSPDLMQTIMKSMFPSSSAVAGTYGRSGQVPGKPSTQFFVRRNHLMKRPAHIYNCIAALMALCLVLPSAERIKMRKLRSLTITQAPAHPGYLNDGEPFALRKAPQLRPPAYALPALPIAPDPQPLPLMSSRPAQPLNPAKVGAPVPGEGAIVRPCLLLRSSRFASRRSHVYRANNSRPTGLEHPRCRIWDNYSKSHIEHFLNPEILQYFNADANGTYRSRILLNGSSLFTLPSMNPLLQRSGSTTYEIK